MVKPRLIATVLCVLGMLCGGAFAAEVTPGRLTAVPKISGWQLEAHIPSNMSPSFSWDCMDFPPQADGFARDYIETMWTPAGCKITKGVLGGDDFASAAIECPFGTRQFEFKKTSETTLGINEIEVDAGGTRNQYLLLLKQCDASIEFDCTETGKVAWRATRPPQAVNYSCEERTPPSAESIDVAKKPDFGFPIEMKKFVVMTNRSGENADNGLPEQCNWYEVDGEAFCYTPTMLEQFVDNSHALSLADIAIELRVGEREFTGSTEYCSDVKALAGQMPWMTGVTCAVEAN
ncbi:hypothetical protein [Agrobacterium cavarae]|uniref:hypothetical protein n=1 Tax=Agrobacterium cavarae TaxID=2528239 RepID=UPI0028AE11E9|nr:hypothetical protein [Agrobacterium cavarae]